MFSFFGAMSDYKKISCLIKAILKLSSKQKRSMTMKKIIILFLAIITTNVFAINSDNFIGLWKTKDGKSIIKIYRKNNEFAGKIVWLAEPLDENGKLKTDIKNPDKNLRQNKLINLELLHGFRLKKSVLKDGKIYDPKSGKTYSCIIKSKKSKLKIRGYIGVSLFGRTEIWTRCSKIPN